MADDLLRLGLYWILPIVVLGSIVDIIQFSWILKRHWQRRQRRIRNQIMAELLFEQHKREKQ